MKQGTTIHSIVWLFLTLFFPTVLFGQLFEIREPEAEMKVGNYINALKEYERLASENKKGNYSDKIGEAQFYLKRYAEAEKSLSAYIEKCKDSPKLRLLLARTQLYLGDYNSAKAQLSRFMDTNPDEGKDLANLLLKSIAYTQENSKDTTSRYTITKSNIKFKGLYLGGASYKNMLYTSQPENLSEEMPHYTFTSLPFGKDDAYKAVTFPMQTSSRYFVGAPSFSSDKNTIYFTMNVSDVLESSKKKLNKNNISASGKNTLSIYSATLKNGAWENAQELPFSSIEFSDTHPCLTSDGKHLFFASNRPGGFGGYDIYYAENEGSGKWSEPINLGNRINTPYDEMNPFALNDSLLYFSSNGKVGFGGADIYYTQGSVKRYAEPQNMGAGFNSYADDFGITFDSSGSHGIFASNRDTKSAQDEIWYFEKRILYITGTGKSKDNFTRNALPGVQILIKEDGSKEPLANIKSDESGKFQFTKFEPGKKYNIISSKDGYHPRTISIDTKTDNMNEIDIFLNPKLKKNDSFTFNDILFDYNKATLQPQSITILNKLADLLNTNIGAIVELGAHTDSRGSLTYNQKLSQRRAESCVSYLISVGVDANRIKAKGYGESQIKNRCTDNVSCSEDEHLINRRVEVKVLEVRELSSR